MRVFVTGATGWIGSASVTELIAAGHQVVGLARSSESAARLAAVGAEARTGDLDDLAALRAGAEEADAVVHLAFKHNFDDFAGAGRTERAAVETFGAALAGTGKPLLFASGLALLVPHPPATEDDPSPFVGGDSPRGGGENLALSFAEQGVHPVALRFAPSVHGAGGDHGFVATLARIARERGFSAYVGDGTNRWAAVHRSDAARLVALALEKAPSGAKVHAAAEEGLPTRDIATALGTALDLPVRSVAPEDAAAHFGWMANFFGAADFAASSAKTRELLGWDPTGSTLLEDIAAGHYPG